jgi:microcin C transport system substrate-binding protein
VRPTRRAVLAGAAAAAGAAALPHGTRAADGRPVLAHGFSPLGDLALPPGFRAFPYVRADAPKGGTLRIARIGAFDTLDGLRYPGRPPPDLGLVRDRLLAPAADEAASWYALLADSVAVSDDLSRVLFRIDPRARWHDGRPVTAHDVEATFRVLRAEGAPFFRQAFRATDLRAEGDGVVAAEGAPGDRDLVRRIAAMPVHPAHALDPPRGAFPLGSGPYRLVEADPPRRIVLERVRDWWGAGLGPNRGRYNFDRIEVDHFHDPAVAFEAFVGGAHDVRFEDDPARWASGYPEPMLASGEIQRAECRTGTAGALHGLAANLRDPRLADRRVRTALALAWDFEAADRTLFDGAAEPFGSVFGDTDLAARGRASEAERDVLARAGVPVPDAVLADPDPLAALPGPGTRAALAAASRLLDEAGFGAAGGVRADPRTGRPLVFRVLSASPAHDRPLGWLAEAWRRLGVGMERGAPDPAAASRRMLDRDFDLAMLSWAPAPLPGTAERLLWHSALADAPGSYALSGLRDPLVDAAAEALEAARSPAQLQAAARAFDRAFRHAMPMLPLWRTDRVRIAWRPAIAGPEPTDGVPPSPVDSWWSVRG